MPSLVSHKLSIIKYVVLKKIIFYFLCFDRLIWTWTWTRTSLDSVLTRTRTSLDSVLTRTRTSLDLDLSWTRQRWTWLQPYLKLSSSTVAKTIQRFNRTGSTQNRPRHGRPNKLSARAQRYIQWLCLGNRRRSAASIAAEVEGVGGQHVGAKTIRCTLH